MPETDEQKAKMEAWKVWKEMLNAPDTSMENKIVLVLMLLVGTGEHALHTEGTPTPNINYVQAVEALNQVESVFDRVEPLFGKVDPLGLMPFSAGGEIRSVKTAFILFYFATHPAETLGEKKLTQAEKKKMAAQYRRFEKFLIKNIGEEAAQQPIKVMDFVSALQVFSESPHLDSHPPESALTLLPKVINAMTTIPIPSETKINTSRSGAKKPKRIETSLILDFTGTKDEKLKLNGQSFTAYDQIVHNAVCSIYYEYGSQQLITPALVWRAMTGKKESENPSRDQINAVRTSLDKMCRIRAEIDYTSELRARKITTVDGRPFDRGMTAGYIMPARLFLAEVGGDIREVYRINEEPILLELARTLNQILTVSSSLLDVKIVKNGRITTTSPPNTERFMVIRAYLLRRIGGMKGKNNLHSSVITLCDYERGPEHHEGLYSIVGCPNPARIQAQRIRETVETMLEFWKAKSFIKGYEKQKQRNKITGYKIEV